MNLENTLWATTLGATHNVVVDHLINTIRPGEYASFAILDDSPVQMEDKLISDNVLRFTISGRKRPHAETT
jgi:predicted amidohydrolase YtcJ